MNHTKTDTLYLDSPCPDIFNGGLGFAVAFLVFRKLIVGVRVAHSQFSCCPQNFLVIYSKRKPCYKGRYISHRGYRGI